LTTVVEERLRLVGVTGYASPQGSRAENALLINERALSVATYVRQYLHLHRILTVVVQVHVGVIKYFPSHFKDQVGILVAR
jgi:hypothetical protein